MATDNHTTIVGNLVDDPELRFTNNGIAVANMHVAVTQRIQQDGEWRDGDTSFLKVNVWRGQAEHLADSLAKGDRVMVTGRLRQRSWETPEGDKRSVTELEADEVGALAQVGHSQGRTLQSPWQRRPQLRPAAAGRTRRRLHRRTADLLNAGRSLGLQPVGSRVPVGRSSTAAAAFGLAPERLCGPVGTRPGVAPQRSALAQGRPARPVTPRQCAWRR